MLYKMQKLWGFLSGKLWIVMYPPVLKFLSPKTKKDWNLEPHTMGATWMSRYIFIRQAEICSTIYEDSTFYFSIYLFRHLLSQDKCKLCSNSVAVAIKNTHYKFSVEIPKAYDVRKVCTQICLVNYSRS